MTRVYLASRYSRRDELCGYREQLHALGYEVTARWLDGSHDWKVGGEVDDHEPPPPEAYQFALDDYWDVRACDALISFTEAPRSGPSRGGRHVEFGLALGFRKRTIVVGHLENVFHLLPQVAYYPTWDEAPAALTPGGPA